MDAVQTPIIPIVGDLIRRTPGTISLGQGVVHYGPPPQVTDAVAAALASRAIHEYGESAGYGPLVEAIAAKLRMENGIDVTRGSRIMVTAGANMAFMHAILAVTAPGDEVILPVPFYFNHEMAVEMAGCRVVRVPTDDRYQLRLHAIAAAVTDRTRAVVTISPNNPTGAVLDEASLRAVNALCADRGLYHISDEPYEYFTYGAAHLSPGSFDAAGGHTISLFSLSKAYGFAGWRIGYAVYPRALEPAMLKSQDTILICPTMAAQIGALAALKVGRAYCEPHVRNLAAVRDLVRDALAPLAPAVTVPTSDGAFYVLLKVDTTLDPMAVAERLITEHKVAVIPGTAFGMDGCTFRVAYGALQRDTVAEGIGRLVTGLRAIFG
ncbi:MAG: pyridoxal phosphate-dependent aminotransferase [Vicinamibacterales bacterium]